MFQKRRIWNPTQCTRVNAFVEIVLLRGMSFWQEYIFPLSSCRVSVLWWKSHPSTVHFDAELFRPFRSIPVDRFAPQADETIPVQLNAEDLPLNERFSFARVRPSWLSFGSAIKYSFLQSRHIIYIWPKYVVEKNLSVLNKKHPLQQMRKKSLKLNLQGHFGAFFVQKWKILWMFVDSKETLPLVFYWTKPKCLSVSVTAENHLFFSLSHSWILRFTPGWAFPLGIPAVAAIKHVRLFAVWIFTGCGFWPLSQPHMRHLSRVSPWPGPFWVSCSINCCIHW